MIDLGAAFFVTRPRLGKRLVGKWTCDQVGEEESKAYLRGSQREKSRAMGNGTSAAVTMVAAEERRWVESGESVGKGAELRMELMLVDACGLIPLNRTKQVG